MRKLLNVLRSERKNKISGGIYNKMQVDFAFNSNHIEGSRLTHEQTRYIYETKTIGADNVPVNDIIETVNHFRCFDYVLDTVSELITEDYIKCLHKTLKNGIMEDSDEIVVGDYKKFPNEVGGMITVMPDKVPDKIRQLLADTDPKMSLYSIISFHAEFERIHPFFDGNGRVGRLIMFKQCLENEIVPFFVDEFYKMFYYKGLQEWQEKDKKERLIDTCLALQDDTKQALDFFGIDYDHTKLKCRDVLNQSR